MSTPEPNSDSIDASSPKPPTKLKHIPRYSPYCVPGDLMYGVDWNESPTASDLEYSPVDTTSCVCRWCDCPLPAQDDEPHRLCMICENAQIWGKTPDEGYKGCMCVCKCKLQRAEGSVQCEDCKRQNKGPGSHRVHFDPAKPRREGKRRGDKTEA